MRVVVVWLVGIFLISIVMFSWYVTQPLLVQSIQVSDTVMDDTGWNSTQSEQTFTILQYFANLWPIPVVLIIGLWMFISAQREDPESRIYG